MRRVIAKRRKCRIPHPFTALVGTTARVQGSDDQLLDTIPGKQGANEERNVDCDFPWLIVPLLRHPHSFLPSFSISYRRNLRYTHTAGPP